MKVWWGSVKAGDLVRFNGMTCKVLRKTGNSAYLVISQGIATMSVHNCFCEPIKEEIK